MKSFTRKRIVIAAICAIAVVAALGASFARGAHKENALSTVIYEETLGPWEGSGIEPVTDVSLTVASADYAKKEQIVNDGIPQGYIGPVVSLTSGDILSFPVDVPKEGLYRIRIDYAMKETSNVNTVLGLMQENEFPFEEAQSIVLTQLLSAQEYPYERDRKGNEIVPDVTNTQIWQSGNFRTLSQKTTDSLLFHLKKGINNLTIQVKQGDLYAGNIYVEAPEETPSYEQYAAGFPKDEGGDGLIVIEAERLTYKNSATPRPSATRDVESYPYESNKYLMNSIGGETWQDNGEVLYYTFDVEKDGWYQFGMKAKQSQAKAATGATGAGTATSTSSGNFIHRSITIDGRVPFKEAGSMLLPSTTDWEVTKLGNEETMYPIYLTAGEHVLGVEVDATMLIPIADEIRELNDQVNDIALEIRKLIGNSTDVYRDWELEKYIPGIRGDLNAIADSLDEQAQTLAEVNMGNDKSKEMTTLKISAETLRTLAEDPDQIPNHMTLLSEGTGSVSQKLGEMTEGLIQQPLSVDQIYFWQSDAHLPEYKVTGFTKFAEGTKYFLDSFHDEEKDEEQKEITVWVNRARTYIDLLQKMADSEFTPETGIKVNFSAMPNEQKLILANTTGTQPDVALGVSSHLPYDLAIRNAVYDLRQFDDFNEVAGRFSPGAFITHMYEDGVYALPETQDFFVLFYRKDLMEKMNIPIPDTWDEVLEILPELQRYGMNFYAPLSINNSFKTYSTTLPFIYQKGATIYNEDGLSVALNSEEGLAAMKFMTELYTIYGVPAQIGDFYQPFRNGTLPIGVSTFATYLKLDAAAAELAGKWDIAPMPGFEDENGIVNRWSTGGGQTSCMFANSKMIDESWEFLKWWSSAEVQSEFGKQMRMLYGDEYVWNTANLEAFEEMPIDDRHKEVILEQWEWLYEFPKTPASYMVEREISNVWNKIVFDGENARSALDDAVILMNQEIARKMEEFGYMKDGKPVKNYEVPTIEQIESWVNEDE